jgi:hypothetical protein
MLQYVNLDLIYPLEMNDTVFKKLNKNLEAMNLNGTNSSKSVKN